MKVKIVDGKIVALTKDMPNQEAYGEFIGFAKIRKEAIEPLKKCTTDFMRDKVFSCYFEAALQKLIGTDHLDFTVLDITGEIWAEIDDIQDYERAIKLFSKGKRVHTY